MSRELTWQIGAAVGLGFVPLPIPSLALVDCALRGESQLASSDSCPHLPFGICVFLLHDQLIGEN